MYPQVLVRDTKKHVSQQVAATTMLKAIESMFLKGDEPTKNSHADHHENRVKVEPNKSCTITCPNSTDLLTPAPVPKDKRNNIRASSFPPPRAVLSSPDNFKKTNLHRTLAQRPYARTQANASQVRVKRPSFNSNMLSQSRDHNSDVKMEKQALQESLSNRSDFSEAATNNVYPKIKCSEIVRDQTPKPSTFKRG